MSVIQFGSIHFVYVAAKHNNSHHEQELGDSGREHEVNYQGAPKCISYLFVTQEEVSPINHA